ncbi:MAG: magnesium chelatase [Planctomycetes bacterium]|nr:magnesium chelatase [Planctomycetota bacterium]
MSSKPCCLGDLDRGRYPPVGVRDEIRANLVRKLRSGEPLFPGIVGYDDTVIPQIVNALLARHDIILLGLRGQAKTRLCRQLVDLLDDEVPAIAGSALREHPLRPLTLESRERVEREGASLPLEWIPREARYGEKLATPDVTMADLIGDIDPLKAAHQKLDLGSEKVIHYGVIPRTNRGIFTINELPDLAPRIQVGLLNLLEERDVQIRGFPVRLVLDVLMVFTANPEDYTSRGSIITPLKDRIASQIQTHYPRSLEDSHEISRGEAWTERNGDLPPVEIPPFVADILEEIAFCGRASEYVDQTSGISARLPIAVRELLVSQVERRIIRNPGAHPIARLVDLTQILPGVTGKVELVYEGEQEGAARVARHLIGKACAKVFDSRFPDVMKEGSEPDEEAAAEKRIDRDRYRPVLRWFAAGHRVDISDEMDDASYCSALESVPGLARLADQFLPSTSREGRAAAMELILEGLHQHSLLAKEDIAAGSSYSDMLGIMMEGLR